MAAPINRLNNYLIEQSEKGVIFYLSNKSIKEANIDPEFDSKMRTMPLKPA